MATTRATTRRTNVRAPDASADPRAVADRALADAAAKLDAAIQAVSEEYDAVQKIRRALKVQHAGDPAFDGVMKEVGRLDRAFNGIADAIGAVKREMER